MKQPGYLTQNDDSRIPAGITVPTLKSGRVSYRSWYLPLTYDSLTLKQALEFQSIVAAPQGKIPEIIRWTEGKDSHLVKEFFYGGVDLVAHDCIHMLLGRGLLTKDEAFVIGFTMGSTNKLETLNKDIFSYIAQHYYPNAYKMNDEAKRVFFDAAKLGFISDGPALDETNFKPYFNRSLDELRSALKLPVNLIQSYYRDIEKRRFPQDPGSSRLITGNLEISPWIFSNEDGQSTLLELAQEKERRLNNSDKEFRCRMADLVALRDEIVDKHRSRLSEQRDLAKACFEEIKKICGDEHPEINRDLATKPWDQYFEKALTNIEETAELLLCPDNRTKWEEPGPGLEARSYVHAILNRGDAPRDRAFCRGFFDGSDDKKSSYSADMKLDMLKNSGVSLDGEYTEDMRRSYHEGVYLAYINDTVSLKEVDWDSFRASTISEVRQRLNLTTSTIESYKMEVEDQRLPASRAE